MCPQHDRHSPVKDIEAVDADRLNGAIEGVDARSPQVRYLPSRGPSKSLGPAAEWIVAATLSLAQLDPFVRRHCFDDATLGLYSLTRSDYSYDLDQGGGLIIVWPNRQTTFFDRPVANFGRRRPFIVDE